MNIVSLWSHADPSAPSQYAAGALCSKTMGETDLYGLFFRGEYQRVASLTVDGSTGVDAASAPAVIASLTFLGRVAEAETLYERFESQLETPHRMMGRFFLGVVKCRHFDFRAARHYFGANRRDLAQNPVDGLRGLECRFYLYQGFGFYRYTYGHLRAALKWAERSFDASFRADFLFGRLFAQDLLAHVQINLGRTHRGLKLIDQNISLAQNLGRGALIQMFKVTRAIYRARFGLSANEAVEELLATLAETVFEDGYSRACLLAELSQQYLLRGNARKAGDALNSACEYVYRVDNPRLEILLNFRVANLLIFKGETAQALHVLRGSLQRLTSHVDRLLELRLLGLDYELAARLGKAEGLDEKRRRLNELTRRTGYFVGRRILARRSGGRVVDIHELQDPLGDLLDGLERRAPEALSTILENGWLGHLYRYCGIDVSQRTILLGLEGRSVTVFDGGTITHVPRGATNLAAKFFLALSRGERTKEQLVREVWEQDYHPLRHDGLIYSLISKLRKDFGAEASWVESTELGYQLQKGVVVTETLTPAAPAERERNISAAPAASPGQMAGLSYRQRQLIQLAARQDSIDVRACVETFEISAATANRDLAYLEKTGFLSRSGRGRATRYHYEKRGESS